MKTLGRITEMVLVVCLVGVFSAFSTKQTTKKKGQEIIHPDVAEKEKAATKEDRNVKLSPASWRVRGRLTSEKDKPLEGLTINLFDKDNVMDDFLGSAVTNENGNFVISYRENDFQDGFIDSNPDLFIEVRDKNGRTVYSSRNAVRFNAGREEVFDIEIRKQKGK